MTELRRRQFLSAAIAAPFVLTAGRALASTSIRISLDTNATHFRTRQVQRFAEALNQASGGEIAAEVFHSAQLYRDRDVGRALRQGAVEMAVPGTWTLAGVDPSIDYASHPATMGQSAEKMHMLSDGPIGAEVGRRTADQLRSQVVGRWLDLGPSASGSVNEISQFSDFQNAKIRVAGGAGQTLRAEHLGAIPSTIPWADVPLAMSQGVFDIIFSSASSLASAQLWETGMRGIFLDDQVFAQYVPLVSDAFLSTLSTQQQDLIYATWEASIDDFRAESVREQAQDVERLVQAGVIVHRPEADDLEATRAMLLERSAEVVAATAIDPEIADQVVEALG